MIQGKHLVIIQDIRGQRSTCIYSSTSEHELNCESAPKALQEVGGVGCIMNFICLQQVLITVN